MARSALETTWDALAVLKLFGEVESYGPIDNLKAQKLAFLYELKGQRKRVRAAHMPFIRYQYGPYSRALVDLLHFLESGEFVEPETRALTSRGRYVLEYALPEIQGGASKHALSLTEAIADDYGNYSGIGLTRLVYAMRVPVHARGGTMATIKPLPMGLDLLNPSAVEGLSEPIDDELQILSELQQEFAISADDLNPANEELQREGMQAIARALDDTTH